MFCSRAHEELSVSDAASVFTERPKPPGRGQCDTERRTSGRRQRPTTRSPTLSRRPTCRLTSEPTTPEQRQYGGLSRGTLSHTRPRCLQGLDPAVHPFAPLLRCTDALVVLFSFRVPHRPLFFAVRSLVYSLRNQVNSWRVECDLRQAVDSRAWSSLSTAPGLGQNSPRVVDLDGVLRAGVVTVSSPRGWRVGLDFRG